MCNRAVIAERFFVFGGVAVRRRSLQVAFGAGLDALECGGWWFGFWHRLQALRDPPTISSFL